MSLEWSLEFAKSINIQHYVSLGGGHQLNHIKLSIFTCDAHNIIDMKWTNISPEAGLLSKYSIQWSIVIMLWYKKDGHLIGNLCIILKCHTTYWGSGWWFEPVLNTLLFWNWTTYHSRSHHTPGGIAHCCHMAHTCCLHSVCNDVLMLC